MKKYSVIDLETTGSNRLGQKIIEIAIINYDGDQIEEVFSTLIHPEKFISHQITLLTDSLASMKMKNRVMHVVFMESYYDLPRSLLELHFI